MKTLLVIPEAGVDNAVAPWQSGPIPCSSVPRKGSRQWQAAGFAGETRREWTPRDWNYGNNHHYHMKHLASHLCLVAGFICLAVLTPAVRAQSLECHSKKSRDDGCAAKAQYENT